MNDRVAELEYLKTVTEYIDSRLASLGGAKRRRESDLYEASRYMWEELPGILRNTDEVNLFSSQNDIIVSLQQSMDDADAHISILEKMRSSPYFGRVDFTPDRGEAFSAYIGSSTLLDENTYTTYVCDWRAPVASLFYENGCGRTSFDSPDGPQRGTVTLWGNTELKTAS